MNFPFELTLYTTQIISFQFLASPFLSLLAYKQAMGKNRKWVQERSEFLAKYPEPKAIVPRIFGAIFLLAIGFGVIQNQSEYILRMTHYASIAAFLFQHLGYDIIRSHFIKKEIPMPERRSAGLTPRQIKDYIPLPLFGTTIGLAALFFSGWTYLYMIGKIAFETFLTGVYGNAFTIGIGLACFLYCLKRKPIRADERTAQLYRQSEVYVTFLILNCFVINAATKLAGHAFDIDVILSSKAVTEYVFTLVPMIAFIWFLLNKNMRSLVYEDLKIQKPTD